MTLKASEIGIPASALKRVAERGERIPITRPDGKAVVLISEDDARLLEALEDRYWGEEARKVESEMAQKSETPVPLQTVKRRLKISATK